MKTIILSIFSIFSSLAIAAPVMIEVNNVKVAAGPIRISLFNHSGSWDSETPDQQPVMSPIQNGTSSTTLDLPPGDYAFFLYNDTNNNGKLEQTWIGMPNEPYAFSNNVRLNMSKPTWQQIKFTVGAEGTKQTVTLIDP
jgi:uncharacterized protein (DUF2141 family)